MYENLPQENRAMNQILTQAIVMNHLSDNEQNM